MRGSRLVSLLAALTVAAALAGCAEEAGGANSHALQQQVCTEADLGGHFVQKSKGTFSVNNLADLSSNSSMRRQQLQSAGLEGGQFAYWEHTVPNPPFKPPIEVVCQAMEFKTAQDASAFVTNLQPTPDDLASTAMTWLPQDHRTVTEVPLDNSTGLNNVRAFRIVAVGPTVRFTIFAVVVNSGAYVRTVYLGNNGNAGTLDAAVKVAQATAERLSAGGE